MNGPIQRLAAWFGVPLDSTQQVGTTLTDFTAAADLDAIPAGWRYDEALWPSVARSASTYLSRRHEDDLVLFGADGWLVREAAAGYRDHLLAADVQGSERLPWEDWFTRVLDEQREVDASGARPPFPDAPEQQVEMQEQISVAWDRALEEAQERAYWQAELDAEDEADRISAVVDTDEYRIAQFEEWAEAAAEAQAREHDHGTAVVMQRLDHENAGPGLDDVEVWNVHGQAEFDPALDAAAPSATVYDDGHEYEGPR